MTASPKPKTERQIAHILQFAMQAAGGIVGGSILAESGAELLLNVADPTGPNGTRTFIIRIQESS